MEKLTFWAMILMAVIMTMGGMTACSSSDNDEDKGYDLSAMSKSEIETAFIGSWNFTSKHTEDGEQWTRKGTWNISANGTIRRQYIAGDGMEEDRTSNWTVENKNGKWYFFGYEIRKLSKDYFYLVKDKDTNGVSAEITGKRIGKADEIENVKEKEQQAKVDLIGIWEEKESGEAYDDIFTFQFKNGGVGHLTVKVKSNGTWKIDEDEDFKYTVNGNTLSIIYYDEDDKSYNDTHIFTFKIINDVLYIYDDSNDPEFILYRKIKMDDNPVLASYIQITKFDITGLADENTMIKKVFKEKGIEYNKTYSGNTVSEIATSLKKKCSDAMLELTNSQYSFSTPHNIIIEGKTNENAFLIIYQGTLNANLL